MQGYNQVDQRIHRLAQLLARVNRTYLKAEDDDSHTNLYFDDTTQRIFGRWTDASEKKLMLGLDLNSLSLEWLDQSRRSIQSLKLEGKSLEEAHGILRTSLGSLGFDLSGFEQPMHYEIPSYPTDSEIITPFEAEALKEWVMYRRMANEVGFKLLGHLQSRSEVRIWPHHFDTGLYTEINNYLGFGFGLAMEDVVVGTPYFYFTAYHLKGGKINYEKTVELTHGKWIIGDRWQGAVLPLTEVNGTTTITVEFIKQVASWFLQGA